MRLTPMRYKDYTWPHNPEVYTVERQRRLVVHQIPFGRCVIQDLGGMYRVLHGEGVFAGDGAYEQFRPLTEVFQEGGAGILIHPVWPKSLFRIMCATALSFGRTGPDMTEA